MAKSGFNADKRGARRYRREGVGQLPFACPRGLLAAGVMLLATAAQAQGLDADLAKKLTESEARANIAEFEAQEANAAASARADLEKKQIEAESARADMYRALAPDPAKYQTADPKAPSMRATSIALSHDEATRLASVIAARLAPEVCSAPTALLADDPRTFQLIAARESAGRQLDLATGQVALARRQLAAAVASANAGGGAKITPKAALPALAGLVNFAFATAKSLKPAYTIDSVDTKFSAEASLSALALAKVLATPGCKARTLDPGAILPPLDGSSQVSAAEATVKREVDGARAEAAAAAAQVGGLGKDEATKVQAALDQLLRIASAAEKTLADLQALDTNGVSVMQLAMRGERLAASLRAQRPHVLKIQTVASDVDIIAKDSLLRSLRVFMSATVVGKWQLTDADGWLLSAGVESSRSGIREVRITPEQLEQR